MKRITHNAINSFVLAITAIWFIYRFHNIHSLFTEKTALSIFTIIGAAILIHAQRTAKKSTENK